jgi:Ca2+-dependent lipid-binding protein
MSPATESDWEKEGFNAGADIVWNEEFHIPIPCLNVDIFRLKLYDCDMIGRDDKIGSLDVPIKSLPLSLVQSGDFDFEPASGVRQFDAQGFYDHRKSHSVEGEALRRGFSDMMMD